MQDLFAVHASAAIPATLTETKFSIETVVPIIWDGFPVFYSHFTEISGSQISAWGAKKMCAKYASGGKGLMWGTQICNLFSADCEMKSGQILSVWPR